MYTRDNGVPIGLFRQFGLDLRTCLAFWQSDPKCRLNGNLFGTMETGIGPAGPHSMAVSWDYISGRVHVRRTCTIGILHRPVLAGAGTIVLLLVY